jgi:hypothetical protein
MPFLTILGLIHPRFAAGLYALETGVYLFDVKAGAMDV